MSVMLIVVLPVKRFLLAVLPGFALSLWGFCAEEREAVSGEEPILEKARAAVQRSLPYIEKTSSAWMVEKKCNSCHVVSFDLWSQVAARARGLVVDPDKLTSSAQWALADSLSDRRWSGFRAQTFMDLKSAGMPEEVLAKLKPLQGRNFSKEKEFIETLEKSLGKDSFDKQRDELLAKAKLPNNGGGPDTLAQLLLALAPVREEAIKNSMDAIRALLLEWQEPDGSWRAQGQLPSMKWEGEREMHDATTMWSLLALSAAGDSGEALVRSRQRALEYLRSVSPGKTVQTLALRLMVKHRFGEAPRADALRQELAGRQNADGGWGWWKEYRTSDAFSTGQALHALGTVGSDFHDPVVRKALEYLAATQKQDGSWEVPQEPITTRPAKLNVFNFWGTAWAAIGTAQVLPAKAASPTPEAAAK